jgi:transposase
MAHAKGCWRETEIQARRAEVGRLRRLGHSYRDIAITLNTSMTTVFKDVKAMNAQWREQAAIDTDAERQLDLERIDAMILGLQGKAERGDEWKVDRVVRLLERRAALLGLDAPRRTVVESRQAEPLRIDLAVERRENLSRLGEEDLAALVAMKRRIEGDGAVTADA